MDREHIVRRSEAPDSSVRLQKNVNTFFVSLTPPTIWYGILLKQNPTRSSNLLGAAKKNTPSFDEVFFLVNPRRFELLAFGSASRRSIQLSYGSIVTRPYMKHIQSRTFVTRRCFHWSFCSQEHRLLYHDHCRRGKLEP